MFKKIADYMFSIKISGIIINNFIHLISVHIAALFITSSLISGCSSISIADSNQLYNFRIVEFRNRTFVIGGEYQSGSDETSNRDIFEITDKLKAFFYKNRLYESYSFTGLKTDELKFVGKLKIDGGVPPDSEFIEFNNRMYMIGGRNGNDRGSAIYASDDMLDWRLVLKSVPWDNNNPRVKHKLGVFNGFMYIAGGTFHDDIWRSSDGAEWTLIRTLHKNVKQLFICNGTFYIHARDDRGNILYSSKNGLEWKKENGFPRHDNAVIVFSDKKLFAVAPHSIYSSDDCRKWTMLVNSPAVNTPCGVYNDLLYIRNLEGLAGICSSSDGINWKSEENGESVSLTPYDMGKDIKNNYDEYKVIEFKNNGWIIGESPDRVYKTSDGLNWKKVEVNRDKRFIHRSKAAAGVFNGFMYIAGGVWTGNIKKNPHKYYIVMNDIWRSSNGIDWELLSGNASWDKMMSGELVSFQNRFFLFGGDRYSGDGSELQVWSSSDGINWSRNTDSEGLSTIINSDIRNSYIGIAELDGKLYLTDKHMGSDILITSDGKKYHKQKITGDMDEYNIRLKNCAAIQFEGKEYVILKKGDEFFFTSDFKKWEKLSFNFSDDYKGDETFDGYTLYKIGSRLSLVNVRFDDKTVIRSVVIKINMKKNILTFTNFKSVNL